MNNFSLFWGGSLVHKCKSALERLWCIDWLHKNAEPGLDVEDSPATSWTWTTATFSTLVTPWSFAPFFFFWQPISDLCFLFLFFSIAKNSIDLASSFFRRNLHFWAFFKREYSSFLGRPERIKVWIFSSLISFLPSSCKNKKIPRTLTCRVY